MMTGGAGSTWGKEGQPLLSLQKAWDRIAAEVTPLGVTTVSLYAAGGRVLARPVAAQGR